MANFGIIREISNSNLGTGRNGSKSGVSGLSGRVDSPAFFLLEEQREHEQREQGENERQ